MVLDAWPILRYQEDQPAARAEVDEVLTDGGLTLVSSINLGEVHYTVAKQKIGLGLGIVDGADRNPDRHSPVPKAFINRRKTPSDLNHPITNYDWDCLMVRLVGAS